MILKMQSAIVPGKWRFIDSIAEVSYEVIDKLDIASDYRVYHYDEEMDTTIQVCITYRNGEGVIIYTDQVMYLLDDNGNTVQRVFNNPEAEN